VVKLLLQAGISVHACVRDPANAAKVDHLWRMAEDSPGTFRLFRADLLEPGSHAEAIADCRIVMLTASPFIDSSKVTDPQRDLVGPALQGTCDILETANRTPSVERVVLTSSTVAVQDPVVALDRPRTEADWNDSGNLETMPYPLWKELSKCEAWKTAEAQDRWKLVVINAGLIVGKRTAPAQISASYDHFRRFGNGAYREGVPSLDVGVVDVRDVAEAHMRATFIPAAEGCHIVFGEIMSLDDIGHVLRENLPPGEWPLPPPNPVEADVRAMEPRQQ